MSSHTQAHLAPPTPLSPGCPFTLIPSSTSPPGPPRSPSLVPRTLCVPRTLTTIVFHWQLWEPSLNNSSVHIWRPRAEGSQVSASIEPRLMVRRAADTCLHLRWWQIATSTNVHAMEFRP